jgi:integrase
MSVFYDKSKEKWVAQVYWVDRDGMAYRPKRQARTKGEAKRLERELEDEKTSGVLEQRRAGLTIAALAQRYLRAKRGTLSRATLNTYAESLNRHVLPHLGERLVSDLKPIHVIDWHSDMIDQGTGTCGVQKAHGCLVRVLNWAVASSLISDNVASKVPKPKHVEKEIEVLTDEQERQLLDASDALGPQWGAMFGLMTCGLTRQEAFAVRWCDLDLEAGRVSVVQAAKEIRGQMEIGTLKTKSRRRTISLKRRVFAALRAHRDAQVAVPLPTSKALVFAAQDGQLLHFANVHNRQWKKVQSQIEGLTKRIGFHSLRHTLAVQLIRANTTPIVVAKILGRTNAKMVVERYAAHFQPHEPDDALARVDAQVHG